MFGRVRSRYAIRTFDGPGALLSAPHLTVV